MSDSRTSREAVLGIETEHAILYLPDDEADGDREPSPRPPFKVMESALFSSLLEGRKSALSGGFKQGYFLGNGGLVHLEVYLRHQEDTPILETATPECRTPWDLVTYLRAYDEILEETSRRTISALRRSGYAGRLAFGKNNQDIHGKGFGCHENYLIHAAPTRLQRLLFFLVLPLLLGSLLPALMGVVLLLGLALLFLCLAGVVFLLSKVLPSLGDWIADVSDKLIEKDRWGLVRVARAGYIYLSSILFFPALILFSAVLRHLVFRRLHRNLTPFLVSRQLLAGSGALNFGKGVFELSQRAGMTRAVAEIIWLGVRKPIFDLKEFVYRPVAFFSAEKKLTITVGDSNLSDLSNLLKVGTTTLLLEMLEAGESFFDLRLRRPVKALRQIAQGGPWKEVSLRSGRRVTAIDIQREYFQRAKNFHGGLPDGDIKRHEILRLWEETLDQVADHSPRLAERLDWAAKKSILDQAVLTKTDWKTFFAWGKLFHLAGLDATSRARDLAELFGQVSFLRRLRLRRHAARQGLQPGDWDWQRDLHFQARKIDLRYHELGGDTSYQRNLEEAGLLLRLTDPAAVEHAVQEPPADTRARIRGHYIATGKATRANWNYVENGLERIKLRDPLDHRLPEK